MTLVIVAGILALGIGVLVTTVVLLVRKLSPPRRYGPRDPRWVAGTAGTFVFFDASSGHQWEPWDSSGPGGGPGWDNSGCRGGSSSSGCGGGSGSSCGGGSSSSCGGGGGCGGGS